MEILFVEADEKKTKPDPSNLGFGKHFTDYMFQMDYDHEHGWYNPRIIPYGPIMVDPSTMVFHYGQCVFEGLKAYKKDGEVRLFRPDENFRRLNVSNERLAIPQIDEEFCVEALKQLVSIERDWIPEEDGTSLYVRPFIIGTDSVLGVHPSNKYSFFIILSPSGRYYKSGLNPVKIFVEDQYVRAVRGGMGFAKTAANYAASLVPQAEAEKNGYEQVLWLDGIDHKYVEEVGSMNIFFKVDGKVITPELNGSILSGITRKSVLELLKKWGIPVEERRISMEEIYEASQNGTLEEVFGTGTAAVISPVGELSWQDKKIIVNNNEIGPVSQRIYDSITNIQSGEEEDAFNWVVTVS